MPDVKLTAEQKPLIVEVLAGSWSVRPQHNPPTRQDEVLMEVFKAIGGVNIKTAPGCYEFNVTPGPDETLVIRLTPVDGRV